MWHRLQSVIPIGKAHRLKSVPLELEKIFQDGPAMRMFVIE